MTSHTDKNFFNLFIRVIGILLGVTFLLFLVATYVGSRTQEVFILQDVSSQAQVLENIRPVGRVVLHGEDVTQTAQVATFEPVAEVRSGPQVYNLACLACHGAGVGGAPVTGETAAWADRIRKGRKVLRDHALNGFTGDVGFMPPKGGRVDLSDTEILAATDYIIEESS